jgi:hypothetical protein
MLVSCLAYSSALEVTCSSEMLVDLRQTTWHYVPEDWTPIFFYRTINSEWYISDMRTYWRINGYFMQDDTAYYSINILNEMFEDRLVNWRLQLVESPDLSPCDFYLWRNLKRTGCIVTTQWMSLSRTFVKQMNSNLHQYFQDTWSLRIEGRHFELLLWWYQCMYVCM